MLQTIFQPFPEMATQRLLLRQVNISDAPELFFLRSDKEVLKYVAREPAKSIEEVKSFINTILQSIKNGEAVMWGIALRTHPATLIGTMGIWQWQKENFRAEVGYVLHPSYWRKGIASEAIEKVLDYGFTKMNLHSVVAKIDPQNIASAKVLLSAGFIKEGYFKEDYFFRGKFSDTEVYSKIKTE